jgi:hypothetical protein
MLSTSHRADASIAQSGRTRGDARMNLLPRQLSTAKFKKRPFLLYFCAVETDILTTTNVKASIHFQSSI